MGHLVITQTIPAEGKTFYTLKAEQDNHPNTSVVLVVKTSQEDVAKWLHDCANTIERKINFGDQHLNFIQE